MTPDAEGKQAYHEGLPQDANPYPRPSTDGALWACGWLIEDVGSTVTIARAKDGTV